MDDQEGDAGCARRDRVAVAVAVVAEQVTVRDTEVCPHERREDVLLRLLRRGVTPRALRVLLPDWQGPIDAAVCRHRREEATLAEDGLAS